MGENEDENEKWMRRALELARRARELGEVPVGAVVVKGGEVVGQGYNRPIADSDPTAHAEVLALRDAARRLGNYRLPGCRLIVTLEPCLMCAGAITHARIAELVYGAADGKTGAIHSRAQALEMGFHNHRARVVAGVLAAECAELLTGFFRARRAGGQPPPR